MAKLIAKVLSTYLAPSMPHLVGPHQSSFICGRCLHENFQLVQSTDRRLHRLKKAALNITKAFDTVDWAFMFSVLAKLGFGPHWISMVCGLLGTTSTCVVVNGIARDRIFNRRGLREGDPLSSLLFDSVMDVLHLMIEGRRMSACSRASPSGLRHHTSMYADDVVTFVRPTQLDLHTCLSIVKDFDVASGLHTSCQVLPSPYLLLARVGGIGAWYSWLRGWLTSLQVPRVAFWHSQGLNGPTSASG
jgi:hypothetical protein